MKTSINKFYIGRLKFLEMLVTSLVVGFAFDYIFHHYHITRSALYFCIHCFLYFHGLFIVY